MAWMLSAAEIAEAVYKLLELQFKYPPVFVNGARIES